MGKGLEGTPLEQLNVAWQGLDDLRCITVWEHTAEFCEPLGA